MNEKDLEELMRHTDEKQEESMQLSFQKKLKKSMNRTLNSRILGALLVIALVGTVLFFGTSAMVDGMFYSPSREEGFLNTDGYQENGEFRLLMEDTIRMLFPNVRAFMIPNHEGENVDSHGFGTYDVDMKILNLNSYIHLDGVPTHQFKIKRSKLDTGYAPFYYMLDEFKEPGSQQTVYDENLPENIGPEIEELPASARLDVSLSFADYKTSDQIAKLIRDYPDISFEWTALKGQNATNVQGVAGGMFLSHNTFESFTEEAKEKYPSYYLFLDLKEDQEITGEDLEMCLKSRLQLLCDHPDFLKMAESGFKGHASIGIMKKRLENAKEEWACYGVRILTSRDDLLKLMEEVPMSQIRINDVKVSKYSK